MGQKSNSGQSRRPDLTEEPSTMSPNSLSEEQASTSPNDRPASGSNRSGVVIRFFSKDSWKSSATSNQEAWHGEENFGAVTETNWQESFTFHNQTILISSVESPCKQTAWDKLAIWSNPSTQPYCTKCGN